MRKSDVVLEFRDWIMGLAEWDPAILEQACHGRFREDYRLKRFPVARYRTGSAK